MKFLSFLVMMLCASLAGWLSARISPRVALNGSPTEPVYERVIRTNELRCAYMVYPPYFVKDPNTGKFSGAYYDFIEELGRQLDLKIAWVQEVGFATMFEGFKNGQYDAVCAGVWALPNRARASDFTIPVSFDSFYAYVRANDSRFGNDVSRVNAEDISISTKEGEISDKIAHVSFPKAKQVAISDLANPTDNFMALTTSKADVVIEEYATGHGFMTANPEKVRLLSDTPVRVGASTLPIPLHEPSLKRLLDITIQHMHDSGLTWQIFSKYEPVPGAFLRPALPYRITP